MKTVVFSPIYGYVEAMSYDDYRLTWSQSVRKARWLDSGSAHYTSKSVLLRAEEYDPGSVVLVGDNDSLCVQAAVHSVHSR